MTTRRPQRKATTPSYPQTDVYLEPGDQVTLVLGALFDDAVGGVEGIANSEPVTNLLTQMVVIQDYNPWIRGCAGLKIAPDGSAL